jgi:Predicted pyridoxal phosphate-dependent enzyme apparently involved in regulation of cell wall biogenesis
MGDLPLGYDHKYTYSHVGYNLKLTDMQAALGVSQLKKLPGFNELRHKNFQILYEGLKDLQEFLILPAATQQAQPNWFGFPLAVRTDAPFTRNDLIRHLDAHKIDTRLLFGGNLTRQPAFKDMACRKIGSLINSDFVMNQVFWIGVYPGLTQEMLNYTLEKIEVFLKR